jgi:hypothetical protein
VPTTVVFDSGSSVGVAADVWQAYRVASDPSPAPFFIYIKVDPFGEVQNSWNLWGYACVEVFDGGINFLLPQTELAAAGATVPAGGTSKRVGVYTMLKMNEWRTVGSRPNGFRAVHFCINRWVGPSRVRVVFVT